MAAAATATPLPPGSYGRPLVGETLAFFADAYGFMRSRYDRYGPVFRTSINGHPTVVLLGAEAQEYVLASHAANFLWREGAAPVYPFFGDGVTFTDGDVHDYLRHIMTPAFHGHHLGRYLATMNIVIDRHLDGWGAAGQRTFYHDARDIAYAMASTLLVGLDDAVDHAAMQRHFVELLHGAMGVIHRDLPGTKYARGLRARRAIDAALLAVIERRRAAPTDDVLGLLMQAHDEEGRALTDAQLIAQAKILLFAGYETTAAALTWMVAEVLQHDEVRAALAEELVTRGVAAPITLDDLRGKPYLDAVVKETLRLHLHPVVSMRGVKETFTYHGYQIPAGWLLMIVPIVTHRMADYFAEPDRFDPTRFLPPREEDKAHRYAWIAFGGGSRLCLGLAIAQLEMKAALIRLLERFDLALVSDQDLRPVYLPNHRVTSDVLLTYSARQSAATEENDD
jgi:retinoid hydroxylase